MINNVYARRAFLWFCCFGIIGVLLDLDHLPYYFGFGQEISSFLQISPVEMGRPLHTLAVIYSGSFLCIFSALGYGLLFSGCLLANYSRRLQMRKYPNPDNPSGTLVLLSPDRDEV